MTEFIIHGAAIVDIPTFYDEINRVFMQGADWQLGNSLDAFNDLLYGGIGAIPPKEPVLLTWLNMDQSRAALGYETTRNYYLAKLAPDSPYNKAHFTAQLAALEAGTGKTYFDIILEVIAAHPNITIQALP
jgi:RNAse (barnase) inhibitor barstar